MASAKFPRIPHVPDSPGGTSDDRRLHSWEPFLGRPVVITEKMDGSNLCLTRDAVFARTHSGPPRHPSFDLAKAWWAEVAHELEPDVSLFGEWLYAKHSIHYTALPGFFLVFGVREDATGLWRSWYQTCALAGRVGTPTVPELWRGTIPRVEPLLDLVKRLAASPSACGGVREGVVLRTLGPFQDVNGSVGKWVRQDHVQTDDEWTSGPIVRNLLAVH